MNKKGFILIDSLINVLIVTLLSFLCLYVYRALDNYEKGHEEYLERSNERYDEVFYRQEVCVRCVPKEDPSTSEP